ncbi:hypothetical protein OESDEN_12468 [Oesophagostomum dentatum]|uniref:Uncharacterized protein n=1 Tax=Oesophagostomum dentatum TaxID=61180 RepID=A0A0B1SS22_OESDE|nr:hypothetical protein OESDEN_12468 [Oesophagostomum dentatum]
MRSVCIVALFFLFTWSPASSYVFKKSYYHPKAYNYYPKSYNYYPKAYNYYPKSYSYYPKSYNYYGSYYSPKSSYYYPKSSYYYAESKSGEFDCENVCYNSVTEGATDLTFKRAAKSTRVFLKVSARNSLAICEMNQN